MAVNWGVWGSRRWVQQEGRKQTRPAQSPRLQPEAKLMDLKTAHRHLLGDLITHTQLTAGLSRQTGTTEPYLRAA